MSCNCNCNDPSCSTCNPCTPACPTESAQCETLPSALENFINAFFGSITRTVVNGQVQWTLPCNLETGLENNPRQANEGLACYFLRLFQDGIIGATGPAGDKGETGTSGHNAFTVTLCIHTVPAAGQNFEIEVLANPVFAVGQTVYINGAGYAEVKLVTGTTLSLTMVEVTGTVGSTYPAGSIVSVTGPRGVAGSAAAKGDPGEAGPQGEKGDPGAAGQGAYTSVTAGYTQPAQNATVVVFVGQTETFAIGSNVFVQDGGTYEVTAKTANSLTLLNLFDSTLNTAPSTAIAAGKLVTNSGERGPEGAETLSIQVEIGGIGDVVAAATDQAYFRAPRDFTVTEVRASLFVASTTGAVTVDINKNGVSILSTVISIDQNDTTSLDSATPPVILDNSILDDDLITIDVDGGGANAEGLIVTVIGTPA